MANADGFSGTGTLSGVVESGAWYVGYGGDVSRSETEFINIEMVPGGVGQRGRGYALC